MKKQIWKHDPNIYKATTEEEVMDVLDSAIEALLPRDKLVIQLRYGLAPITERHTLRACASILGVSFERIRQIEGRAKLKIKKYMGDKINL